MKPRILLVMGTSTGGVGRHVAALAKDLNERAEVTIAAPENTPSVDGWPRLRTISIAASAHPRRDLAAVRQLAELLKEFDVVHAHGLRAGALTLIAAQVYRRRARVLVTLHNLPVGGPRVRAISAVLERIVARGAYAVMGVSLDICDRMRERGATRVQRALVPAPARQEPTQSPAAVRQELQIPADAFWVLTVARLAPQKGLSFWVDAAATLSSDQTLGTWCGSIVGDGPLAEELGQQIRTTGAQLELLGYRDDIPNLLSAADLVVLPSLWEGQPLAVQEALAYGRAVVTTDAGGTKEVAGEAAVLVPPADSDALASAVASLIGDSARRKALEQAALNQAAQFPTRADVVEQVWAQLFERH